MVSEGLLSGLRMLDLCGEEGAFCGKIFADLGADVIKVEKPGGDAARNRGPFYHDIPDNQKSLDWFAYNINKRGITLNIESNDGREIFQDLVKKADFVVESFAPGDLGGLGVGYETLAKINPRIIMTAITPFGQTGPYRDYKASDLVVMAMGGLVYVTGEPDRAPVRIGYPQAYLMASVDAAVGTIVAHYHRELTGEGQYVDVSAQQVLTGTLMDGWIYWETNQTILVRAGAWQYRPTTKNARRILWPCKDGAVTAAILGGLPGAGYNQRLVNWMDEEGMAPQFMKDMDWSKLDYQAATQEYLNTIHDAVADFFKQHTMAELFEKGLEKNVQIFPVLTTKGVLESVQLKARGFWTDVEHPELNATITYPGPFAKLSETPIRLYCRPPLIGEHNEDILGGELGLSTEELVSLKEWGVI